MLMRILTLAAVCLLAACSASSVHPIYTDADPPLVEPRLPGTWKTDDDDATYTISAEGDSYRLLIKDTDPAKPDTVHEWPVEVRLVQVGEHRFADFTAPESERDAFGEKWGPLFLPMHLFARYQLEDDTLRVWVVDRDWLRKNLRDGSVTLAHTWLSRETVLITAETPQLREFLATFGADPAAFPHQTTLKRLP